MNAYKQWPPGGKYDYFIKVFGGFLHGHSCPLLTIHEERQTQMPPRNLASIVNQCLSKGQCRRLKRLIYQRLAGRDLTKRRFVQQITKKTDARTLIRQILSTYQ